MNLIDDQKCVEYQRRQFEKPKYSTVAFEQFLSRNDCFRPGTEVLDIGAGGGDVMLYFAKNHPETRFLGVDYNKANIGLGRKIQAKAGVKNFSIDAGDWFDLPDSYVGRFDGIYNVHTLCCFKHLKKALDSLAKLEPRWLAFNSLFYDGPLDVLIHIRDLERPELKDNDSDSDFNIFSLPEMKRQLAKNGYGEFEFERFKIPAGLPKPAGGKRGTYTIRTEFDERTQFSGPVHLPWHFALAKKLC